MTIKCLNFYKSVVYTLLLTFASLSFVVLSTNTSYAQYKEIEKDPISLLGDYVGLTHQIGKYDLIPFELFDLLHSRKQTDKFLDGRTYLSFNEDIFKQLQQMSPDQFSFTFRGDDQEAFEIAFEKTNLLSEDYVLRTCEEVRTSKLVTSYISSSEDYKANCLIYEDHIYLNVYTPQTIFRLNNKNKSKEYYLYTDVTAIKKDLVCGTHDEEHLITTKPSQNENTLTREKSAVQIYFEIDYAKYLDHGSDVVPAEEHLISLFADVATFYAEHFVDIEISEIMVWTSNDPYAQHNTLPYVLDRFGQEMHNGFNGDLAHLVSGRNIGGGLAWIGGLCQGIEVYMADWDNDGIEEEHYSGAHSISGNHTIDLVDFPEYSWNVQVIAHELGHSMGSPHTHACTWGPNGDEPLDNCWATEGSCNSGPTPFDGGTIMSFCHLSYQGINFEHGFGDEPGALIYDAFANASCVDGEELPGEVCSQAIPLPTNGSLGCSGPSTGHGSSHLDAIHSRWYIYEPTEDMMVSFTSCGSAENTRLWVYVGTCQNMTMIASNDDNCTSGSSMVEEINFVADKTYFIEWDNKWSSDPFDFEIMMLPESNCIDALPNPLLDGEYHVDGNINVNEPGIINESLILKSNQSIQLDAGFEMNSNYDFEIKIEECIITGG